MTTAPATDRRANRWANPEADRPKREFDRHLFGRLTLVRLDECAATQGLPPFNVAIHSDEDYCLVFKAQLTPLPPLKFTRDTKQGWPDFSKKFRATRESLVALGYTTPDQILSLEGQWAHIEERPTGDKYTAKTGERAGQQVDELYWHFLAVFSSEEACSNAFAAHAMSGKEEKSGAQLAAGTRPSAPAATSAPAASPFEAQARTILPQLWIAAAEDDATFEQLVSTHPVLKKAGITVDHPLVRELVPGFIPF